MFPPVTGRDDAETLSNARGVVRGEPREGDILKPRSTTRRELIENAGEGDSRRRLT